MPAQITPIYTALDLPELGALQNLQRRGTVGVFASHREVDGAWAFPDEVVGQVLRGRGDIAAAGRGVAAPDPIGVSGHDDYPLLALD